MKSIRHIVTAALLAGGLSTAHAQGVPFTGCNGERIAIFSVNGILVTDKSARKNKEILKRKILGRTSNLVLNQSCFHVDYLLNESEISLGGTSPLQDLVESYAQGVEQNGWVGHWGVLFDRYDTIEEMQSAFLTIANSDLFAGRTVDIIKSQTETTADIAGFNAASISKVTEMMDVYGAKVILVGHSQGNFFANGLYNQIVGSAASSEALRVVGIATPSSYVAPELLGRNYPYTTNHADIIAQVDDNLPSNIGGDGICDDSSIPMSDLSQGILCHLFGRYMRTAKFREDILNNIFADVVTESVATRITSFAANDPQVDRAIDHNGQVVMEAQSSGSSDYKLLVAQGPNAIPTLFTSGNFEDPEQLQSHQGSVYFTSQNNFGRQIYKADVTQTSESYRIIQHKFANEYTVDSFGFVGDHLVASVSYANLPSRVHVVQNVHQNPNGMLREMVGINPDMDSFRRIGSTVFFIAQTTTSPRSNTVWTVDATTMSGATPLVGHPNINNFGAEIGSAVIFDEKYCFVLSRSTIPRIHELWCTDGVTPAFVTRIVRGSGAIVKTLVATPSRIYAHLNVYPGIISVDSDGVLRNHLQTSASSVERSIMGVQGDTLFTTESTEFASVLYKLTPTNDMQELVYHAIDVLHSPVIQDDLLYIAGTKILYAVTGDGDVSTVAFEGFSENVMTIGNLFPSDTGLIVLAHDPVNSWELWQKR